MDADRCPRILFGCARAPDLRSQTRVCRGFSRQESDSPHRVRSRGDSEHLRTPGLQACVRERHSLLPHRFINPVRSFPARGVAPAKGGSNFCAAQRGTKVGVISLCRFPARLRGCALPVVPFQSRWPETAATNSLAPHGFSPRISHIHGQALGSWNSNCDSTKSSECVQPRGTRRKLSPKWVWPMQDSAHAVGESSC